MAVRGLGDGSLSRGIAGSGGSGDSVGETGEAGREDIN
jgi:hypothetical protein